MNSTSRNTTKKHQHLSRDNILGIVSSTAPAASVEAFESKISPLEVLLLQNASECSSLSSLSISTAVANTSVVQGGGMHELRIPTKSENCKPGPTLNPSSCASGLALIGGGGRRGEGNDWIPTLSKSSNGTDADANAGSSDMDTQGERIPTKSENCEPGPTLNPSSCASGLAMMVGGFGEEEGNDWTSALQTMYVDSINGAQVQGNTHRRNPSHPNEDWGDLHYHHAQGNMFLDEGDI